MEAFYHKDTGTRGKSVNEGEEPLNQCGECHDQHDDKGRNQCAHFSSGYFEEDAERDQYQCAQQLVGASEQRPDIRVTNLG